jgi:L-malate glycosyltransferase
MIANFLNDHRIYERYEVSFSYRKSERYELGLRSRVSNPALGECYPILAGNVLTKRFAKMPKPIRVVVLALNYLLLLRYLVLLWNVLVLYLAWKPRAIDVLHINNGGYPAQSSCLAAAIAARLAGIRSVIMVVNNIADLNQYRHWWLERPLDFIVAKSVTMFITGSKTANRALQIVLKLSSSKLVTLHNGIQVRRASESRLKTRNRLGLRETDFVFGVVALLERRKGHSVLLSSMKMLLGNIGINRMPVLLIEGDGPELSALQNQIVQLEIEQWVRFIGVEHNVFNFMSAVDVMILPSVANEDFPNVVLEAMCLGKPVIASRIAGTVEQIDDGITGWLVEPADVSALASRMEVTMNNNALIETVGASARAKFNECFTAEIAVSNYLNLYETLNRRVS